MKARRDGIIETQNVAIVEEAGVTPQAEKKVSSSLGSQSSAVLQHTVIPNLKSGRLQSVTVSAEVPWKATVQKFDGTTTTDIAVIHGLPGESFTFIPVNPRAALHGVLSTGVSRYQVVVLNNNPTYASILAPIYITTEWDEYTT